MGEDGNIHHEYNPCNVEQPKQMNTPSRTTSPSVPLNILTTPLPTNLQQSPGLSRGPSLNCPLISNVTNQRGIGATLLMARGVSHNANHAPMRPRPSSETMPDNTGTATRSFPSSSTVDECGLVSAIGILTQTRTAARISNESTLPLTNGIRIGIGQLSSPSNPSHGISH